MANQVQARFYLQEVTRTPYYTTTSPGRTEATRVRLSPVQGEPFGTATPQGSIDMLIVNPEAGAIFQSAPINQQFDILISPVEEEAQQ